MFALQHSGVAVQLSKSSGSLYLSLHLVVLSAIGGGTSCSAGLYGLVSSSESLSESRCFSLHVLLRASRDEGAGFVVARFASGVVESSSLLTVSPLLSQGAVQVTVSLLSQAAVTATADAVGALEDDADCFSDPLRASPMHPLQNWSSSPIP